MKLKTIGGSFLNLVDVVLMIEDEEYCKKVTPLLRDFYIQVKNTAKEQSKKDNGGKLPNPESPGWSEEFWVKKINQVINRRESIKRVLAAKREEEARITRGKRQDKTLEDRVAELEEKTK